MNAPHDKFCVLPWISLETSTVGAVRPCCLAEEEITDDQGEKFDLRQADLDQVQHSKYMQNLRQQFLAGEQPDTCRKCWQEERSGRVSKRMNATKRLLGTAEQTTFTADPGPLRFLDLKLGNLCNLKCRICGPWASSSAAVDELQQLNLNPRRQHYLYGMLQQGNWPQDNPGFWQQIQRLLDQIRYLEFSGGEPFMIMRHFDLLEKIIDHGRADQVEIHYNTNGTQFPSRGPEIWKRFRKVEIAFSIDDVQHRFEYQRSNAKWDQVCNTLDQFRQLRRDHSNIKLQSCSTVNVFNVMYLPQLANWLDQQSFDYIYWNMLHVPSNLSIAGLPEKAKQVASAELNSATASDQHQTEFARIINFMQQGQSLDAMELLQKIQNLDQRRQTDLRDHHPELATAIGYEGP